MKIPRDFSENSNIFLKCNSLRRSDTGSRRILITGGSGFVGTWLAEHFVSEGAFVVSLSAGAEPESRFVKDGVHEKVAHVVGSVEDYAALDERSTTSTPCSTSPRCRWRARRSRRRSRRSTSTSEARTTSSRCAGCTRTA